MGSVLAAFQEEEHKATEEEDFEEGQEGLHAVPTGADAVQDRPAAGEWRVLYEAQREGRQGYGEEDGKGKVPGISKEEEEGSFFFLEMFVVHLLC